MQRYTQWRNMQMASVQHADVEKMWKIGETVEIECKKMNLNCNIETPQYWVMLIS